MPREVKIGSTVKDHFSVLEDDGYTKHSGLTGGDFTTTVYLDSAPVVLTVTIVEIGTSGEYEYSFVPAASGVYDIEIFINYNFDRWGASFLSVPELSSEVSGNILNQCEKIDLVPTVGPHSVTTGSLMDRVMNKNASKTFNQGTDSLEAVRDRLG